MKAETLAIHGPKAYKANTGDVINPISLSTTFYRDEAGNYPGGHMYSRISNPNRLQLEQTVAALSHGVDAAAFASGNAAGMSIFQALSPGSHIIAPDDMYWGLKKQLLSMFEGILTFDFIDLTDIDKLQQSLRKETKLVWIETPSNPLLKVTDIEAIARITKTLNIILACDSTFASPILQNPFYWGADLVMHSSTKYIGGHSDVLGGIVITAEKNAFWAKIKNIQESGGAVPAPFDCYLLLRSLKTLAYRMRGHCENARILTDFLQAHPMVEEVFYPGLQSHPQHQVAKKQMSDFGGMFSFLVKGGAAEALRCVNRVKLFTQATSLGGVESLIEHRASVEGPNTLTPGNLIRVSVGLEHYSDLLADLEQALEL